MVNIRVDHLAMALGVSSRLILAYVNQQGRAAKGPSSTLEPALADEVRSALLTGDVNAQGARRGKSLNATPEHQRRVIAVLASSETSPGEEWDHVSLVPPPVNRPRGALERRLYDRGLLKVGSVLVQSPFDPDRYELLDKSQDQFALNKLFIYDRVAGLLGASSFSVEELLVQQGDQKFTVRAEGKHPMVHGEGSLGRERSETFSRFLEVSSSYVPSQPDLTEVDSVVAENRLFHDSTMEHLISAVRDGVQKKHLALRLNLTEEASRNFEVGVKIQSQIAARGGASFDSSHKEVSDLQILLRVEFEY